MLIKMIEKGRSLYTVKVFYDPHMSVFSFSYDGINKHFYGSDVEFKIFLQRCKVSDNSTQPRSKRQITYRQIIDNIIDGSDITICMWSNIFNKLPHRMKLKNEE